MTQALARVLAAIVKVALGDDTQGADGGEHPAFNAVDLEHAIVFSNRPTLTPSRQVEILREHISRVAIVHMIAFARTAAAAATSVAEVVAVAVV